MKAKLYTLLLAVLLLQIAHSQVIRPFTPRYSNASVRGNIVYVSNSIISTSGVGAGNPGTGETPPGGTSRDNNGAGINIDIDVPAAIPPVDFFSLNSTANLWKYWSNNLANAPASTWKDPAFNDASWPEGTGSAYTYNNTGNTDVGFGPSQNSRYPTVYFRKTFTITDPSLYTDFVISLRRDDGAAVYLNGVEISRTNLSAGATYSTLATSSVEGAGEYITINLANTAFNNGSNTLAVEVHNANTGNNPSNQTDLVFDMSLTGNLPQTPDPAFNSSSADLNLLSCSDILWAGLYWGADQGTSGSNETWITAGYDSVKLKLPGSSSYQVIASQQTDRHSAANSPGLPHTGYLCFADITSLLNSSNANGTYTVANVVGPIGINNSCGGWTIVVAYANASLQPRNLTVFDGSVIINGGDPAVDISINGFLTPPSGPVSCELGAVVYDGDRSSTDAFSFRQNGAGSFYNLATTAVPLNGAGDAWNSKISYKGAVVTTRNPAFNNTLGYDASIFELPNTSNAQLSNNQTSATVRFSSPSENYFVQVLTTSVSQYNPSFAVEKSATDINGGQLSPGDVLRYQVAYNNVGNDSSAATVIYDNIPAGTTYIPGSLNISGLSKTDGSGDDQAEYDLVNNRVVFRVGNGANASNGGVVSTNGTGYITFDVVVASSCEVLSCVGSITNRASMQYVGATSLQALSDSSGVNISGCILPEPDVRTVGEGCYVPGDTLLVNICPVITLTLPYMQYGGYRFYSAKPFVDANLVDPAIIISATHTYWAYFSNGAGCSDTIQINAYIIACPDIDDDNDGIPDYVEINDPVALQDADNDGISNWMDTDYPAFTDNNADGFNDYFDPGADADNDGIVNFLDIDFPGFADINGDGVNDSMDKDLDGIPNNLDLDSDNDGIPDVVESFGVDANGDGRIDNYSDTDNDGFSQNVDGSNAGVAGSANGLGMVDTDGDGIPNYLDLDSDNDGVPDITEVYGMDSDNNGMIDNYQDDDGDGLADSVDGDVGNDGFVESSANALLLTGADANNDGRADHFPFKNMDADNKPNPYDLDSDGDGITDVKEAGFTDANNDGRADGAFNLDGWNNTIAAAGSLNLPNTDAIGRPNLYDIDADNDGIPDNIEGQLTTNYFFPSGLDSDGDGIDNVYDNFAGFGGSGIIPLDTDVDGSPDYRDTDTDSDGISDLLEGNDLNLNGVLDDNIALTGIDSDGDGLDDFFDNNNSAAEGTSARMGTGGSTSGDSSPGSTTTVQRSGASNCANQERDWRCTQFILNRVQLGKPFLAESKKEDNSVQLMPNPVKQALHVIIHASRQQVAEIRILDGTGRNLRGYKERIHAGTNRLSYNETADFPEGIYYLQIKWLDKMNTFKFQVLR